MEQTDKYVDIVMVRHGDTSNKDMKLLEAGDAPLSEDGIEQAKAAGQLLAGMSFDLMARGAALRMRETTKHVTKNVTYKKWIFDQRLDPCTNSRSGVLYPEGANDSLSLEYHPRTIAIFQNYASRYPDGGRVLAITSGAYLAPASVIAAGIVPLNEKHYAGDVYKAFAPVPGEVRCFRYHLGSGKVEQIDLDIVKQS